MRSDRFVGNIRNLCSLTTHFKILNVRHVDSAAKLGREIAPLGAGTPRRGRAQHILRTHACLCFLWPLLKGNTSPTGPSRLALAIVISSAGQNSARASRCVVQDAMKGWFRVGSQAPRPCRSRLGDRRPAPSLSDQPGNRPRRSPAHPGVLVSQAALFGNLSYSFSFHWNLLCRKLGKPGFYGVAHIMPRSGINSCAGTRL
jgi:hypothetical protein